MYSVICFQTYTIYCCLHILLIVHFSINEAVHLKLCKLCTQFGHPSLKIALCHSMSKAHFMSFAEMSFSSPDLTLLSTPGTYYLQAVGGMHLTIHESRLWRVDTLCTLSRAPEIHNIETKVIFFICVIKEWKSHPVLSHCDLPGNCVAKIGCLIWDGWRKSLLNGCVSECSHSMKVVFHWSWYDCMWQWCHWERHHLFLLMKLGLSNPGRWFCFSACDVGTSIGPFIKLTNASWRSLKIPRCDKFYQGGRHKQRRSIWHRKWGAASTKSLKQWRNR